MSGVKNAFAAVGGIVLVVGFMVLMGLLAFVFIRGGLWVSEMLYPILVSISGLTFAAVIFVLLPNAIFSAIPKTAGSGMVIASYIFGACLWTWSFLLAYAMWGWVGLAVGLFMAGVGVVPVAALASLLHAEWFILLQLAVLLLLTFGLRVWGLHLLTKAERRAAARASLA
jgi:hypothetical protein